MFSAEIQDRYKDLILFFTVTGSEDTLIDARKLGSGRWGLWSESFREYIRQPLGDIILGLGLGKHWELTQAAYNPFIEVQGGQVDTHSDYLGLLFQLGPIALGCYLYLQYQVVKFGSWLAKNAPDKFTRELGGLAAAMSISVFITNTISNGFVNRTTLGWLFWGIAGLMLAAMLRVKEQQAQTIQLQSDAAK